MGDTGSMGYPCPAGTSAEAGRYLKALQMDWTPVPRHLNSSQSGENLTVTSWPFCFIKLLSMTGSALPLWAELSASTCF